MSNPTIRSLLRLVVGALVILAFWAAGEWLARTLSLPVPGSIVGMLLLTASLRLRVVPLAAVQDSATLVVRHMAIFFVPLGVGLIRYAELLRRDWLPISAGVVGSTVAVLVVVGCLQQRLEPGD